MTHFRRYVAATAAVAVMTFAATTPANAVYDSRGNLVMIIITGDGEVYY